MTDASSLVMTGVVAYVLASHSTLHPGNAPQPAAMTREVVLTLVAPAATTAPQTLLRPAASDVTPSPIQQPKHTAQAQAAHRAAPHRPSLHHLSSPRTRAAPLVPQSAQAAPGTDPPAAVAKADIVAPRTALAGREALYTALIHTIIERNKSNPDGAAYRMLHPHGTTLVGFSLSRAGAIDVPHVIASSGSDMLDRQAEHIVVTCRFPAMPEGIFPDAASHGFAVAITFPPFGAAD